MNFRDIKNKKGFTLIEIMVVIAIVMILASIIIMSISEARQNSREKRRVADLAEIQFALTLYKEENYRATGTRNGYPTYNSGSNIGRGLAIDSVIAEYMGSTPSDPTNTGNYTYYYHSNFNCTAAGQQVILAYRTEQIKNSNFTTVCPSSPHVSFVGSYIVVLQ